MLNTIDEPFVPLTSAAPATGPRTDLRVAIVSQGGNAQPFRPLGQPAAGQPAATPGTACEPRIAVQREGDRVSSIQIQCACGQVIELACVYEPAPGQT